MRNLIKTIIILLIPITIKATDMDIIKIRNLYYKASANRADAESFFKIMQANLSIGQSLGDGYKGMSFMIKANFDFNPYYKLSYFVKGKDFLDNAVKSDPENIELRFLRFCVQTNAPGFLGYSGKITEDKNMIKKYYVTLQDEDLKKRIKEYMINSRSCSKEEKLFFNNG